MSKETKKPAGYSAFTLFPMGVGFAVGGLALDQPAFAYTGLGLLIPGVVLFSVSCWSKFRRA